MIISSRPWLSLILPNLKSFPNFHVPSNSMVQKFCSMFALVSKPLPKYPPGKTLNFHIRKKGETSSAHLYTNTQ